MYILLNADREYCRIAEMADVPLNCRWSLQNSLLIIQNILIPFKYIKENPSELCIWLYFKSNQNSNQNQFLLNQIKSNQFFNQIKSNHWIMICQKVGCSNRQELFHLSVTNAKYNCHHINYNWWANWEFQTRQIVMG